MQIQQCLFVLLKEILSKALAGRGVESFINGAVQLFRVSVASGEPKVYKPKIQVINGGDI